MNKPESKTVTILGWLYCGAVVFFAILLIYSYIKYQSPKPMSAFSRMLSPLWSPTSDPILNFIIDAFLIILAVIVGIPGFLLVLALAICSLVLLLLIEFFPWLSSISITGAILSGLIVIGMIVLIVRYMLKSYFKTRSDSGKPLASTYSSDSTYLDSGRTFSSLSSEPNLNPILKASRIEKAILSKDKLLKNSAGEKIGSLEKAMLSKDQIIKDSSGTKRGRIEQSIWDKDKQIIKDADGRKEGEIKTDNWGNRIMVDSHGKKIGKIDKNIWGETVIKKK